MIPMNLLTDQKRLTHIVNKLMDTTGENVEGGINWLFGISRFRLLYLHRQDFLGGPVVGTPPSNARNVGSVPGWGTNISHAAGQLSTHALEPTHHN